MRDLGYGASLNILYIDNEFETALRKTCCLSSPLHENASSTSEISRTGALSS